jgi:hypothetical protein
LSSNKESEKMNKSTMESAIQTEAAALLEMDEASLEQLLAARLTAIQQDPSLSLQPTFEVQEFGLADLPPWIGGPIQDMVNTALRQMHRVLCSGEEEFRDLRNQLVGAILGGGGLAAIVTFVAGMLTGIGLAAAVATIIATIVIKKVGQPAFDAGVERLCAELALLLPPEETPA